MTQEMKHSIPHTRNLTISLSVLGLMLLSGIGNWSGPSRLVIAVCAGTITIGSIFTTLMAMGGARTKRLPGSEVFIALLAAVTLGTSTVMVQLDRYGLFQKEDATRGESISVSNMPMMGPKTFIAGPSAAAQREAQGPLPSPPDPQVEAAVQRIQELVAQADNRLKAGDRKGAVPVLEEALVLFDKLPQPNMKRRGPIAFALARARADLKQVDAAILVLDEHFKKIAPLLRQESLKDDPSESILHQDAAGLLEEAGVILGNAGRFEETLPRFEQSIAIKEEIRAPTADIASTLSKLAISHGRLNNKQEAEQALGKAKDLLAAMNPPDYSGLENLKAIADEYGLKY